MCGGGFGSQPWGTSSVPLQRHAHSYFGKPAEVDSILLGARPRRHVGPIADITAPKSLAESPCPRRHLCLYRTSSHIPLGAATFYGVWLALGLGGLVVADRRPDKLTAWWHWLIALGLLILAHWVYLTTAL